MYLLLTCDIFRCTKTKCSYYNLSCGLYKRPRVEPTPAAAAFHVAEDSAFASRPSSSSAPSSSFRIETSLTAIMDQLQHMRADFGSRLDHISDEMCQMNTKISRIAR